MRHVVLAALLSAACSGPASPCRLDIAESTVDFGDVIVGQPKTVAIHLANSGGTACAIAISFLPSTGTFQTETPALSVAPSSTAELPIAYAPTAVGRRDTSRLAVNASPTLTLRGRGLAGPPTCTDGLQDGAETGVDCGGTCPYPCDGPACYGPWECESGVCGVVSPAPEKVPGWTDPAGDVDWAAGDIVGGSASVWNQGVDLRVQWRAVPFGPDRHQDVTLCIDTDQDATTGAACGPALPGADVRIALPGGVIQPGGVLDAPCLQSSFDEATRTMHFGFEIDRFPAGHADQFRYVVVSDYSGTTSGHDSAPDHPDFATDGGSFMSVAQLGFWFSNFSCCGFAARHCPAGRCQPPRCIDRVQNGTETGVDCGGDCPAACH